MGVDLLPGPLRNSKSGVQVWGAPLYQGEPCQPYHVSVPTVTNPDPNPVKIKAYHMAPGCLVQGLELKSSSSCFLTLNLVVP